MLKKLLTRDSEQRLGAGNLDAEEIKSHKYFEDIDWVKFENKTVTPPKLTFKPDPMHKFKKPRQFEDYSDLQISSDKSQYTYFPNWSFLGNSNTKNK